MYIYKYVRVYTYSTTLYINVHKWLLQLGISFLILFVHTLCNRYYTDERGVISLSVRGEADKWWWYHYEHRQCIICYKSRDDICKITSDIRNNCISDITSRGLYYSLLDLCNIRMFYIWHVFPITNLLWYTIPFFVRSCFVSRQFIIFLLEYSAIFTVQKPSVFMSFWTAVIS